MPPFHSLVRRRIRTTIASAIMTSAYFCRSCKLPLVISDSLQDLSNGQKNLLTLNYNEKPSSLTDIPSSERSNPTNIYNEYPKIPDSRMAIFKEALNLSSGRSDVVNNENKSKNESSLNLERGGTTIDDKQNTDPTDALGNNVTYDHGPNLHHSFVYLHDKRHTEEDDAYHSFAGSSSLNNGTGSADSDRPFKTSEIKDIINKKSDISERVDSLDTIFNIISTKYEIDYPVCSDCSNTLINQMKIKYDTLNKEKNVYMQFLKKLTAQNGPNIGKTKKALEDIEKLNQEEEDILKQLSHENDRHLELNKELAELEKEIKELAIEERELCIKKNQYEIEMEANLQELSISKNKYYRNMDFLDSLRKTNVFNNFFDISNDGTFGTINKLRLGCLDDVKVTWHEINAALGQVILLLSTCLKILDLDLDGYKLVPVGSTSTIEKFEKDQSTGKVTKSTIQLYCTGEFSIGGFFSHNNLDMGMVCLGEIIRQIGVYIEALDSTSKIPYAVERDKIGGFCVRPSSRSGWVSWTNSCRCILINSKWILAVSIAHYEQQHHNQ